MVNHIQLRNCIFQSFYTFFYLIKKDLDAMTWAKLFQMWNNAIAQHENKGQRRAALDIFHGLIKTHWNLIKSNDRNLDFRVKDSLLGLMCSPYLLRNLPVKIKSCFFNNKKRSFRSEQYSQRTDSLTKSGFNPKQAKKEIIDAVNQWIRLYISSPAALIPDNKEDKGPGKTKRGA